MSVSEDSPQHTAEPPSQSTVMLLLGTIGDTTWRMFVPIISLLLLGDWLDRQWDMRPWLALTGALVGSIIAGLLIKQQLKKK